MFRARPIVLLSFLTAGCFAADNDEADAGAGALDPSSASLESPEQEGKVDACTGRTLVDTAGHRWVAKPALFAQPGEVYPSGEEATARPRPDEMTVEELAEALRPIALWDGCEYTLDRPPIEWAESAMANGNLEQLFDGYRGYAPSPFAPDELESVSRAGVFGSDDREDRRDNTSYPMRTQVYLSDSNGGGCSATLIGRSTAISAAHCVHTGWGWRPDIVWSPGADSLDPSGSPARPMFPYKPGDTYPTTDLANPMRPCKLISIPSGYIGNDKDWDFAVLEFNIAIGGTPGCGEQPGGVVGWLAWGVVSDSATEGRHGYTYGYPRNSTNQGCGNNYTNCSGSSCREPTIWGWGNTTLNPTSSYKLEHTIDVTRGQSGAGLYVKEADGTRRVIATNTGCISPFIGADYNYGRRIDSTMVSFIRNTSAL